MPEVDKPDDEWNVELVLLNTECPHLFFPRSIHGCKLRYNIMDDERCCKENCMNVLGKKP